MKKNIKCSLFEGFYRFQTGRYLLVLDYHDRLRKTVSQTWSGKVWDWMSGKLLCWRNIDIHNVCTLNMVARAQMCSTAPARQLKVALSAFLKEKASREEWAGETIWHALCAVYWHYEEAQTERSQSFSTMTHSMFTLPASFIQSSCWVSFQSRWNLFDAGLFQDHAHVSAGLFQDYLFDWGKLKL